MRPSPSPPPSFRPRRTSLFQKDPAHRRPRPRVVPAGSRRWLTCDALLAARRGRLYDPAAATFVAMGDVADTNALGELSRARRLLGRRRDPEPKGASPSSGTARRRASSRPLSELLEPSGTPHVPPSGGALGGAQSLLLTKLTRDGTLHPARRRDPHCRQGLTSCTLRSTPAPFPLTVTRSSFRPRPLQRLRRVHGGLRGGEQRPTAPERGRPSEPAPPGCGPRGRGRDGPAAFVPIDVPAVRHNTPCVVGLPAERHRRRPANRHRGPDPRPLPRLPLLHGGVPVPRPLLQLVGPGVAGRDEEDAQPRGLAPGRAASSRSATSATDGCRPPARGRPSAAARPRSTRATTSRLRRGLPVRGDLLRRPADDREERGRPAREGPRALPPPRSGSAPSRRSSTAPTGLGAAPGRRLHRARGHDDRMDDDPAIGLRPGGRPSRPLPPLARPLGRPPRRRPLRRLPVPRRAASTRRTWTTGSPSASGSTST